MMKDKKTENKSVLSSRQSVKSARLTQGIPTGAVCSVMPLSGWQCHCALCARFDSVFHGHLYTELPEFNNCSRKMEACSYCSSRCRCQPVLATRMVSSPKLSKPRDKICFDAYAKSKQDVFSNLPRKQISGIGSKRNSYSPQYTTYPNDVYFSQCKEVNDIKNSSRYVFYSNLENFYRQLYNRAREKTTACSQLL